MRFYLIIFFFLLLNSAFTQSGLIINELVSKNHESFIDEDGDNSDWIELYNSGTDTLLLSQYYLSDDNDDTKMWQFPAVELPPNEYLIVFASGKDRATPINHWETALNGDSLWRYLNPTGQTYYEYLYWSEPDYDDSAWEWKRGAFGIGYDNIETISSDTLHKIYLRNEFNISDTSQILAMCLHAYYDDGFTAYLNGYEILRVNMLNDGKKPVYEISSFRLHPSKIDSGDPPPRFDIDPNLWKSLIRNGENVLAIQTHNYWNHYPLVIQPWFTMAVADSIFQTEVHSNELTKPILSFHSNFKISSDGEKIYLSDSLGQIIQKVESPNLKTDHSFGNHPQLADSLIRFATPSPGIANNTSYFPDYLVDSCILTSPSGFYNDSVLIQIANADSNYRAFLTLDGQLPDTLSIAYDSAFWIDSTVVVRIQYFSDSLSFSPISNYSYFINDSTSLDVYSIITDPHNLWDEEDGIYVYGNNYWQSYPYFEANFWQRWERAALIQSFSEEGELVWEDNIGLKIHGNYTRTLPQKSFGFYAKSIYGENRFKERLFPSKPYIDNLKRVLLRNAGNDNYQAHMRDVLIHTRMDETNVGVQVGYPVSSYLNGDYWGVYHLREKIDRYYLENNYGVSPDEVNLLEENSEIISGDRNEFEPIVAYITTHDLSEDHHYQYISDKIDIENWVDLYIANLYHFNSDWPHHNSKYWNAPGKKWQHLLQDLDVSTHISSSVSAEENSLPRIHKDTVSYLAVFYKKLLENENFKRYYINRFADLMNTILKSDEYIPLFDSIKTLMAPEMYRHCERWNMNYSNWINGYYTDHVEEFLQDRPAYMRQFLRERYELGTYDTISLSVEPMGKGQIALNSLKIKEQDWQGLYFDSIPIRLEAIPNPGFEFVRWESESSPNLADSGRILNQYYLKSFDDITAVFFSPTGTEDTLNIAFSEIYYQEWENAETGNWIEIYNRESDTLDLGNWELHGNKPYQIWKFPEEVKIAPNGFMVVAQDSSKFKKWFPEINCIGDFEFDLVLDEKGKLSLVDELERLVTTFEFATENPWPEINENAFSIELLELESNEQLAENWQLGCPGGSPGMAPNDCEEEYPLMITEIKYSSHANYETKDWFELVNKGEQAIDMSHWILHDDNPNNGVKFPFGYELQPHEYLIVIQDTAAFFNHYPDTALWFGPVDFGLSASGESIQFYNHFGKNVFALEYSSSEPWPEDAGNNGKNIEIIDTTLNMHNGGNWSSNCFMGTPWTGIDWCIEPNSIWITEVKYQSAPDSISGDWVELYNTNDRAVDLENWSLIIQGDTLTIDTTLQIFPDEYMVFTADSASFYSVYDSSLFSFELGYFDLPKEESSIIVLDPYHFPGKILNYHYLLNWPILQTDTNNKTLELVDFSNTFIPENWRASCEFGTPTLPHTFCNTDGINSFENEIALTVKPNPTTGFVNIDFDLNNAEQIEINIIDYQGNIILNQSQYFNSIGTQTIQLDLNRLQSGIYLLQLIGTDFSGHSKIIKIEE